MERYVGGLDLVFRDCLDERLYDEIEGMEIHERTRDALLLMYRTGACRQIHSRIGIGREGIVYHATNSRGQDVAIKVYTSPIRHIKNRFDFNIEEVEVTDMTYPYPPKPELRAFDRMKDAGIRCPTPIEKCEHVMVVEFLGKNGVPAPTLSVAPISLEQYPLCYKELIKVMRTLYQKCKLVHGDLSETNVLYHEGHLYLIGASQSVDTHHVYASKLLKKDCARVLNFFRRRCVAVMTVEELLDFVCDPCIPDESVDSYLETIQQKTLARNRGVSAHGKTLADSLLLEYIGNSTVVNKEEGDKESIVSGEGQYQADTIPGGMQKTAASCVRAQQAVNQRDRS